MKLERRILILEKEIHYYEIVYPKSNKLKLLKKELNNLKKTKCISQ